MYEERINNEVKRAERINKEKEDAEKHVFIDEIN
jgi:hypothetical protein